MPETMLTAPLGQVASITMGQSPDSAHVNADERGLPFLQGCAEFAARFPVARVHCFPPLRVARAGSTLISVRAPVGTTNRADHDYCIGRGLAAVLAKPSVAADIFLLHAIEENLAYLHRRSQGSTFLAICSADLTTMPVALPALPQQQRIAEILSTVDEAIEHTEAIIAKTQQIKAGLMHDLFTRGVTPDGQLRPPREEAPQLYKESLTGWIPKEWEPVTLGDLYAEPARNGLYKPAQFHGRGPLMVQMGNIFRGLSVDFGGAPRIEVTNVEFQTYELREGDLLFGRRSLVLEGAGKCALVGKLHEPSTFESSIIRVRLDKGRISPEFAALFLSSDAAYRNRRRFIRQVAVSGVSGGDVKGFAMIVPSPDEQYEICERINAVRGQFKSTRAEVQKLGMLKQGLMHDLLTGQVQVTASSSPNEVEVAPNV